MKVKTLHKWNISITEATSLQKDLASQLNINGEPSKVETIAGIDMAYDKRTNRGFVSIVILSYPALNVIEVVNNNAPIIMPYVPGYLSFREAPLILQTLEKLTITPDLIFIDGQGIAHPRGLGLAAHIGLFVDIPVIGVAKSLLIGKYDEPDKEMGSFRKLLYQDKIVGYVLRSRDNVKPIFISPGNNIGTIEAREWAIKLITKYRIPEPTRLADKIVAKYKKECLDELKN